MVALLTRDPRATVCDAFEAAEPRSSPFRHWRLRAILPERLARQLARLPASPPDLGRGSGRRELHNDQRRYLAGSQLARQELGQLAAIFQDAVLVRAIMALTGALLIGSFLRIEYAVDAAGFWLEPHTDLGVKLFTLLLQLGGPDQAQLGTDLYFGPGAWAERAPFGWNAGLAFVPAADTWHGFEPRPIAGLRRSVIVNYVTPEWRDRDQLAFPDRPVSCGSG